MISVVIPAHNEASVIGRLLVGLLTDARPDELQIVVVANGCSDETAEIAGTFGPSVSVVSTPVPSKAHALQLGNMHAQGFPRLYVDADVELQTSDVRTLAGALTEPGILAVAPARVHRLDGRPLAVRSYYKVWEQLPTVNSGLFGRGVFGVNADGYRRLAAMPEAISDDLIASVAFTESERRIVTDAQVVVHPPRTVSDLVRTRVRALTGTVQLQRQLPETVAGARTSNGDLLAMVRRRPAVATPMVVFLAITALVRWKARRTIRSGDFTTWLRDDSSRAVVIPTQRRVATETPAEENA